MIELQEEGMLRFAFPEVHWDARMRIHLLRTLRIPDDGRDYPLPPSLGPVPVRHVDDFAERVPEDWRRHGGVMLPMYQSEALWLHFESIGYPMAIKVAAGKINAVTGEPWRKELHGNSQDYLVSPAQQRLDGYCVKQGTIRQFVAMPLGAGYTAEEQLTGEAEHGGVQLAVYPMKREAYKRIQMNLIDRLNRLGICYAALPTAREAAADLGLEMGLGAGGRMKQEIYGEPYTLDDWDIAAGSRCFVHIANSLVWRSITGEEPPTVPPTAEEYTRAGFPWFDYYADNRETVDGAPVLAGLKSVAQIGWEKGDVPLPENESVHTPRVITLEERPGSMVVRESTV